MASGTASTSPPTMLSLRGMTVSGSQQMATGVPIWSGATTSDGWRQEQSVRLLPCRSRARCLARNPRAAACSRTAASLRRKLSFNFKSTVWICAQHCRMSTHKSLIDDNGSPAAEAMESDRNQS